MMGCGRRVPGAIAAPTGRHPRMVSEHSRGSARLTALARAISETRPGNGSLEVEQRVCKIVGHVTSCRAGIAPAEDPSLSTAHCYGKARLYDRTSDQVTLDEVYVRRRYGRW